MALRPAQVFAGQVDKFPLGVSPPLAPSAHVKGAAEVDRLEFGVVKVDVALGLEGPFFQFGPSAADEIEGFYPVFPLLQSPGDVVGLEIRIIVPATRGRNLSAVDPHRAQFLAALQHQRQRAGKAPVDKGPDDADLGGLPDGRVHGLVDPKGVALQDQLILHPALAVVDHHHVVFQRAVRKFHFFAEQDLLVRPAGQSLQSVGAGAVDRRLSPQVQHDVFAPLQRELVFLPLPGKAGPAVPGQGVAHKDDLSLLAGPDGQPQRQRAEVLLPVQFEDWPQPVAAELFFHQGGAQGERLQKALGLPLPEEVGGLPLHPFGQLLHVKQQPAAPGKFLQQGAGLPGGADPQGQDYGPVGVPVHPKPAAPGLGPELPHQGLVAQMKVHVDGQQIFQQHPVGRGQLAAVLLHAPAGQGIREGLQGQRFADIAVAREDPAHGIEHQHLGPPLSHGRVFGQLLHGPGDPVKFFVIVEMKGKGGRIVPLAPARCRIGRQMETGGVDPVHGLKKPEIQPVRGAGGVSGGPKGLGEHAGLVHLFSRRGDLLEQGDRGRPFAQHVNAGHPEIGITGHDRALGLDLGKHPVLGRHVAGKKKAVSPAPGAELTRVGGPVALGHQPAVVVLDPVSSRRRQKKEVFLQRVAVFFLKQFEQPLGVGIAVVGQLWLVGEDAGNGGAEQVPHLPGVGLVGAVQKGPDSIQIHQIGVAGIFSPHKGGVLPLEAGQNLVVRPKFLRLDGEHPGLTEGRIPPGHPAAGIARGPAVFVVEPGLQPVLTGGLGRKADPVEPLFRKIFHLQPGSGMHKKAADPRGLKALDDLVQAIFFQIAVPGPKCQNALHKKSPCGPSGRRPGTYLLGVLYTICAEKASGFPQKLGRLVLLFFKRPSWVDLGVLTAGSFPWTDRGPPFRTVPGLSVR